MEIVDCESLEGERGHRLDVKGYDPLHVAPESVYSNVVILRVVCVT